MSDSVVGSEFAEEKGLLDDGSTREPVPLTRDEIRAASTEPFCEVYWRAEKPAMRIRLHCADGASHACKAPKTVPVEVALGSLENAVQRHQGKGRRRGEHASSGLITLEVLVPGQTAGEALVPGNALLWDGQRFPVRENPPRMFAASLVYTRFCAAFCPLVVEPHAVDSDGSRLAGQVVVLWQDDNDDGATVVGEGACFVPALADVGRRLRALAVPVSADGRVGAALHLPVPEPVAPPPRVGRTALPPPPGSFRAVSYNVLFAGHAQAEKEHSAQFPYCDLRWLMKDYRQALVWREVLALAPDVLCLQEVGRHNFQQFFLPLAHAAGFSAAFTCKLGATSNEGVATFLRQARFRVVAAADLAMAHAPQWHADVRAVCDAHPESTRYPMTQVGTVGHCLVAESVDRPGQRLRVLNTHLYYNPAGAHVKALQALEMARLLAGEGPQAASRTTLVPQPPDAGHFFARRPGDACLFAGDLNSLPDSLVVELLQTGVGPAAHPDWGCMGTFRWGEPLPAPGEPFEPVDLVAPFALQEVYAPQAPPTNLTHDFVAKIDYLMYGSGLELVGCLPVPDGVGPIPSEAYPSDHVSIGGDFHWV